MRRLINGNFKIAKMGAVGKLHELCKNPVKDKLAGIHKKKCEGFENAVSQGARMSGLNSFLPGLGHSDDMEHQRLKLGEVTPKKKKKEEDEE